jgi:RNA polymerase primary sigma factor
MNDKARFLEKLSGLLALAKGQESRITIEEVKAYFSEDALTEEQMELVFDYLLAQKISVIGYVKMDIGEEEKEVEYTEEEKAYLKEYEMDLQAISQATPEELEELYRQAMDGEEVAKNRLVEVYLKDVVEIAKQMYEPEVFLGDLIQEGNLGLVLGVEMLTSVQTVAQARDIITRQIRQSIQMLLEEQNELNSRDKKMVEKVQALDEAITALAEELGRKVTIDELAIYMGMEIEEIEDILKLTGEESETEEEEA